MDQLISEPLTERDTTAGRISPIYVAAAAMVRFELNPGSEQVEYLKDDAYDGLLSHEVALATALACEMLQTFKDLQGRKCRDSTTS